MGNEAALIAEIEELKREKHDDEAQWKSDVLRELNEVKTSLLEISTNAAQCRAECHACLQEVSGNLKAMHVILTGNGSPEKGLVLRVDRLEQTQNKKTKWALVLVPVLVSGLLLSSWEVVKKLFRI